MSLKRYQEIVLRRWSTHEDFEARNLFTKKNFFVNMRDKKIVQKMCGVGGLLLGKKDKFYLILCAENYLRLI